MFHGVRLFTDHQIYFQSCSEIKQYQKSFNKIELLILCNLSDIVACELGVVGNFWPEKSQAKVLNQMSFEPSEFNTKSSGIIFCAKMSWYSNYKYCLQEESTHFGERVSTRLIWGTFWSGIHFSIENYKRKISNIHKYFLNYTNFLWIFF